MTETAPFWGLKEIFLIYSVLSTTEATELRSLRKRKRYVLKKSVTTYLLSFGSWISGKPYLWRGVCESGVTIFIFFFFLNFLQGTINEIKSISTKNAERKNRNRFLTTC